MKFIGLLVRSSSANIANSVINISLVLLIYSKYGTADINHYLTYVSILATLDLVCSYQISNHIARESKFSLERFFVSSKFESFNFLFSIPFVFVFLYTFNYPIAVFSICLVFVFRNLYSINGYLRRENAEFYYFYCLVLSSIVKLISVIFINKLEYLLLVFAISEIITVIVLNVFIYRKFGIFLFKAPRFSSQIFKENSTINLHQFVNIPFNQLDVIILNFFFQQHDVNAYKFSRRMVGFVGRIANPMNNLILNRLVAGYDYQNLIVRSVAIVGVACFLTILVVVQMGDDFSLGQYNNILFDKAFVVIGVAELMLALSSTVYVIYLAQRRDLHFLYVIVFANVLGASFLLLGMDLSTVFFVYAGIMWFFGLFYAIK